MSQSSIPSKSVIILGKRQAVHYQLPFQLRRHYQQKQHFKNTIIIECLIYLYQTQTITSPIMNGVPAIFYGTAWKKQKTAELVSLALKSGFRAIDTACQPKHYNEQGVGEGITLSGVPRQQLFLQTKFTPIDGQDPTRVPYNPKDNLKTQVKTSFQVSLKNLNTQYLDSIVLHSPLSSLQRTLQVWQTFQQFIKTNQVRFLGISNCYSLQFFKALYDKVKVKPSYLQNRFYAQSGYDKQLRSFCKQRGIKYQSFWTLSANPHILQSKTMVGLSKKYGKTAQQLMYATLISEGIIPLIGTTSKQHMKDDIQIINFNMQTQDIQLVLQLCQ